MLVVDNDEALARAMEESLAKVGYECIVATSGPEGARKIETDTFDIVVTDLVMNDVDGMEILARARQALPDAEVILVTGHATRSQGGRGDAAGGVQLSRKADHHDSAAGRLRESGRRDSAEAAERRTPRAARRAVRLRRDHFRLARRCRRSSTG